MSELLEIVSMASSLSDTVNMIMEIMQALGFMAYIMLILALIVPYVVNGFMIMCVGRKARLNADWMPFVPVARQLYQMEIAGCPWWYVFLFQNCFITWAINGVLMLVFGNVFKSGILMMLVLAVYWIATLIFTFFYYRRYYARFGFNPNTAWIEIIWTFGIVRTVLLVLVAFSDAIRFRQDLTDPEEFERVSPVARDTDGDYTGSPARTGASRVSGRNRKPVSVTGVSGKYTGAAFDVSDGAAVMFGRSATDANIVFDQFETDISRKHCAVKYDAVSDQFVVTDHSTNGTYLEDGTALTPGQPTTVSRGSVIYLGKNKKNSFRLG